LAPDTILLRGGTVIDEGGKRVADVLVRAGVVAAVGLGLEEMGKRALVLDASGCIVSPGLVDLHSHLREPGREEAETVDTGARAAALGGYTAVVAMPNTEPPADSAAVVRHVLELGSTAMCEVAVAGAITVGRAGKLLAPMAEMAALGVRLFTDDGNGVQDARLMRRALEYASALGVTLAQHCEDESLAAGGHMHEGEWSSRLGVPGIPGEAEELMVMRDLALSRMTGAPVHFLHLSTAASLQMVREAKAAGARVTAEVAPHHFTLTDAAVASYDPVFKVNPRSSRRWPTAQWTPSPPTTRPTPKRRKRCRSTRRPRACSGWRRRWRWPSPSSTFRSRRSSPSSRGNRRPLPAWPAVTAGPLSPARRPTSA